jgi:hypothetical protein
MFASLGSHVASGYRIRRPRQNRGTLAVGDGCQEVWATVLRSGSSLWSGVPAGTKGLALICDDPDAPAATWVHWVLYDLFSREPRPTLWPMRIAACGI